MPLSPADISTLSRLLDEAMDLPPAEARVWLDALPEAHRHLAPQLRDMLAEHLVEGRAGFMSDGPRLAAAASDDTLAHAGDRIGAYRLLNEIGHGGMGTVWLAERADGAGLKRRVALKLPRLAWGAGLAERMARERDIGALLEHPNIARLYDAGVDARGRPYLALEYIEGQPIDAWCASRALTVRARLQLFLQVARAVAYAHGRLVVHRDLKPSNVIVDNDGQSHLLDFGIAKLLDDVDDGLTQEQGRMLTPGYASPEQIRGESVTVASDVYSLGALLYELLTGRHAHAATDRSRAAIEAAVLGEDAPLASTGLADRVAAKALRGEIDSILSKALRRDPAQRYATADALADAIERHLDGERVVAQPDSLAYRLSKTMRRHRTAFGAAAAISVAILGAAFVSMAQARRASAAADQARVVKEFVVGVLRVNAPGGRSDTDLRQMPAELLIDRGARLIDTQFPGQEAVRAELYGVVGRIFLDMGANELAAANARKQIDVLATGEGTAADATEAKLLLGRALFNQNRVVEAEAVARQALDLAAANRDLRLEALVLMAESSRVQGKTAEVGSLLDQVDGEMGPASRPTVVGARAKKLRAELLDSENQFDRARPLALAAIDEAVAAEGTQSPAAIAIRLWLANRMLWYGRTDETQALRQAALDGLRASGVAGELRAARLEATFTKSLFNNGQLPLSRAVATVEEDRAAVISKGPLAPSRFLAYVDLNLGAIYVYAGRYDMADQILARVLPQLRTIDADSPSELMYYAFLQGYVDMQLGRHVEAEAQLAKVIALAKATGLASQPSMSFDYANVAMNLAMQGRFDDAQAFLASAPTFGDSRKAGPNFASANRHIQLQRAKVELYRGDPAAALRLMPPVDDTPGRQMNDVDFESGMVHGEILCNLGQHAQGLRLLEEALRVQDEETVFRNKFHPTRPELARLRAVTGRCALANGRRDIAEAQAKLMRAAIADQPDVSPFYKKPSARLEALLTLKTR